MRTHRRTAATAVATLALAGIGLLGLTACAGAAPDAAGRQAASTGEELAGLDVEQQALAALGFEPAEMAAAPGEPAPEASSSKPARPGGKGLRGDRRPLKRDLLRERVLHAEAVVQDKDGKVSTVLSQHGTITALNGTSVTVKSADGFTLTWTFDKDLRVVERRRTVQPSDLAAGAEIGVAGAKQADGGVATLIVRRVKR